MNIKKFFKEKGVGYYFNAAALVCAIVALILYLQTGVTEFASELDSAITVAYSIFIVLAAITLVYDVRIVMFAASAVGLYAFAMYIVFELNYLTNLLVAIDPTDLTMSFLFTLIFALLTWAFSLVSAILTKTGIRALNKKEETV